MAEESRKPSGFLETVGVAPASGRRRGASLGDAGGRPRLTARSPRAAADGQEPPPSRRAHSRRHDEPDDRHLEPIVREWLVELRMMGRSPRTIEWYRHEVLRAFASWADREGYPVDPALLRVRAPKDDRGQDPARDRDAAVRAVRPDHRRLRGRR
jgi:hypothetical protein